MSKCPFAAMKVQDEAAISAVLKETTSAAHMAAEHHPIQQKLVRGQATRAEYAAWLGQMAHIHAAVDEALETERGGNAAVAAVFKEHHRRRDRAEQDLRALGTEKGPSIRATQAFIEQIRGMRGSELLGVLYVIEGSSNGGVFIAKAVEKGLGLEPGVATQAINPHGAATREKWAEFKTSIDGASLSGAERAAAVRAAEMTFAGLTSMMDELVR